jgi:hypothetical protein
MLIFPYSPEACQLPTKIIKLYFKAKFITIFIFAVSGFLQYVCQFWRKDQLFLSI